MTPMRTSRQVLGTSALAGMVALAGLAALAAPARAVVISVDGVSWNVTATSVSADTPVAEFVPQYISSQPWNQSQATARKFAEALGVKLNFPNEQQYGPFFAYSSEVVSEPNAPVEALYNSAGIVSPGTTYEFFSLPSSESNTYATATRVTSDVPGPLPVLGGMAAFGWSRRLRRRVVVRPRP